MLAADYLRLWFEREGYPYKVPQIRVSVGFPEGSRAGSTGAVISQCWPTSATEDGVAQIFVSPTINDSHEVLANLVHELGHAIVGNQHGRGRSPFWLYCKTVGLEGPITATVKGPKLEPVFNHIVSLLGKYEDLHGRIVFSSRKKQATAMRKVVCPCCGDLYRQTQKHRAVKERMIKDGKLICAVCIHQEPECRGLCRQQGGGGGQPPPPKTDDLSMIPPPPSGGGGGGQGPQPPNDPAGDAGKGQDEGGTDSPQDGEPENDEADEGAEQEGGSPEQADTSAGNDPSSAAFAVGGVKFARVKPSEIHRKDLCPFGTGCPQCENDW